MNPLNSPLEVGIRLLLVLDATFPRALDVTELSACDYRLLHSGEVGGPSSVHPNLPSLPGELGIKRSLIETGLQVLIRARLASLETESDGIRFKATEDAHGFVNVLQSTHVRRLQGRIDWVLEHLDADPESGYVGELYRSWEGRADQHIERGDGA